MGYRVKNLLALDADGYHDSFVFYIPSDNFEYDWISDWVDLRFSDIAVRLPDNAVFVAPAAEHLEAEYRESFLTSCVSAGLARSAVGLVHSQVPFLAIVDRDDSMAVAIDLSVYDRPGLDRLFDELLGMLRSGNPMLLAQRVKGLGPEVDRRSSIPAYLLEEVIELKPNIFGIGVDFNAILRRFRKR